MTGDDVTALAQAVSDLLGSLDAGDVVTRVEFMIAADGSHRPLALVYAFDRANDLEQEFRVTLAAGADAPAWARVFSSNLAEVRVGDEWTEI